MNKQKVLITAVPIILVILVVILTSAGSGEAETLMVTPTKGPFRVAVTTSGELEAVNNTPIEGPGMVRQTRGMMGSGMGMTIQDIVPEGTVVEKGDYVATLDRTNIQNQINEYEQVTLVSYQNQLESAILDCTMTLANARNNLVNLEYSVEQAQLEMEQSQYEAPATKRQAEIAYEKAIRSLEQAKTEYVLRVQQAKTQIVQRESELLRRQRELQQYYELMSQYTIYAPANGMVIYVRERDGSKRTEGSSLDFFDPVVANLPDLTTMQSVTFVSEVDIQKVKVGQKVEVGIDAFPEKRLTGRAISVANVGEERANSDSKVFEVIVLIDGTDPDLRPAMTTSNTIIVADTTDVLYVPLEAIRSDDTLTYVYKKTSRGITKQEIKLGLINDTDAVIEEGLTLADEVYLTAPPETEDVLLSYLE